LHGKNALNLILALRELTALPRPLAGIWEGNRSKARGGMKGEEKGGGGKWRKRKEREGKGRSIALPSAVPRRKPALLCVDFYIFFSQSF